MSSPSVPPTNEPVTNAPSTNATEAPPKATEASTNVAEVPTPVATTANEPLASGPPAAGGTYPLSSFGYTPTYPTSSYQVGSAGSADQAATDEAASPSWPWSPRKWAAVIAAALLCGVLAGLAWVGWSSRTVADITVAPPKPAAAGPGARGPAADQAAALAVEAWLHGGGQLVIDNLATDYRRVAAAMTANDMTELNAACSALRSSAETAQAYPPIPDSEAQVHWSASLAQSARAGTDCLAGLSANSGVLITQGGHEAGASSRESALMNARIGTLRGN